MLQVEDQEYLEEVKDFADKTGQRANLDSKLAYLGDYNENTRCRLYKDFAPYSFAFVMERKCNNGEWKVVFNGGLIYHGSHDNGGDGSAPTYSVNVEPMNGWNVHT